MLLSVERLHTYNSSQGFVATRYLSQKSYISLYILFVETDAKARWPKTRLALSSSQIGAPSNSVCLFRNSSQYSDSRACVGRIAAQPT